MEFIMKSNGHFVDGVVLIQFDGFSDRINDDFTGIAVLQMAFKVCADIGVDIFIYIII